MDGAERGLENDLQDLGVRSEGMFTKIAAIGVEMVIVIAVGAMLKATVLPTLGWSFIVGGFLTILIYNIWGRP